MSSRTHRHRRTDDPEHPFVLFGPAGYIADWTVLLNAACVGAPKGTQANIARWTTDLLCHLQVVPGGSEVIAMTAKRKVSQSCLRGFVAAKGYDVEFAGSEGGFKVSRKKGGTSDVDHGLRVLERLFGMMKALFAASRKIMKDPMRVGRRARKFRLALSNRRHAEARKGGAKSKRPRRSPSDRFLRVATPGKRKWGGPRPVVPDLSANIETWAAEDGWPAVLRAQQIIEASSGCRDFEARTRDMYDLLVGGSSNEIHSPNKNSRGVRVKWLKLNGRRMTYILGYINGDRRRRDASGRGLAHFRRLAEIVGAGGDGAAEAEAELRAASILLGATAGKPPSYRTKARWFRRSVLQRGVAATGHMQRHEHTTVRVAEIDAMDIGEEAKVALIREHGRDKHWADPDEMVEYYGADSVRRRRLRVEVQMQDRADARMLAHQRRGDDQLDLPAASIIDGSPVPRILADAFVEMPE